jgi:ubiquinone/menaquinone biosynthesis C-methylase UbiE
MTDAKRTEYWNSYYQGKDVPSLPSQFAVFVLGEYSFQTAVDIGCGSGRDTFFFRSLGLTSFGLDGSEQAVAACNKKVADLAIDRISFHTVDVADPSLAPSIEELLSGVADKGPVLLYARFFLHAINDAEEDALLASAKRVLSQRNGILALEYRTTRDKSLQKVTPDHYRRFVDPASLISKGGKLGFAADYSVEGFGMAKYRADDAYVARTVLKLVS